MPCVNRWKRHLCGAICSALMLVVAGAATAQTAAKACPALTPELAKLQADWRQAPRVKAHGGAGAAKGWERQTILDAMWKQVEFKGMPRATLLCLLGTPGNSGTDLTNGSRFDDFSVRSKDYDGRIDNALRIDSAADGTVRPNSIGDRQFFDSEECHCPDCLASAPGISSQLLERSGLIGTPARELPTLAQMERLLGPGTYRDTPLGSGRRFLSFGETWRMTDAPHTWVYSFGEFAYRGTDPVKVRKALAFDQTVYYLYRVDYWPGCMAP